MQGETTDIISIIEKQVEGKDPKDIEDIYLENIKNAQFTPEFRMKLQQFPNLVCFGLSNVSFSNINMLPQLNRLLRLEICYSSFDVKSLSEITYLFPRLVSLRLVGCNITSLSQIDCLTGLKNLIQLDLFNNSIYKFNLEYESFHKKIFEKFPKLQYLDNLKEDYTRACTIPQGQLVPSQLILEVDIPVAPKNIDKQHGKSPQNHSASSNLRSHKGSNKRRLEINSEEDDDYHEESEEENHRQSYNTRTRKQVHRAD